MSRVSRAAVSSILVVLTVASMPRAASRAAAAGGLAAAGVPCQSNNALTSVMSDRYNPRGLAFGPEGALYVAEAGCGGNINDCQTPAPAATCRVLPFGEGSITRCFGSTSRVGRRRPAPR